MEGIDALNSLKPNLEQKTGYCGPQRPESDKKSMVSCVSQPQVSELRNLKLELEIGSMKYSKLLIEIGISEVDIYMKDFSVFVIFLKTALGIFFKKSVYLSSDTSC